VVRERVSGLRDVVTYKWHQVWSFYHFTRTPIALTLDTLKLKRRPFVAQSSDGLKLLILPNTGDSFTFYENVIRRDYLQNVPKIKLGSTIVDIGANIGAFSIVAASVVGPKGRVIAVEPIATTFARLRQNVTLNGLQNILCCHAAIDATEGVITFRIFSKSAYATAHKIKSSNDGRSEESPCFTLERVFSEYGIDRIHFLKIDCEGSEHGIFETLRPETAARVDQIAMEVHQVEGRSIDTLDERLTSLGFSVQRGPIWFASNKRLSN
jgi:FkbM family methyltransferase